MGPTWVLAVAAARGCNEPQLSAAGRVGEREGSPQRCLPSSGHLHTPQGQGQPLSLQIPPHLQGRGLPLGQPA